MLVKKRYAQHTIQGKAIPFLFLSLVLMLSFVNVVNVGSASSAPVNYIDIESDETEVRTSGDFQFSAGSKIPMGKTYCTWLIRPDGKLRWYLYDPEGSIKFYKEVEEIHETESGKGWVDDPNIYVPWFPTQGSWKLALVIRGPLFGIIEKTVVSYHFNVGESSLVENIMAPVCVTFGGLPVVKFFEVSWALPGIFWLTSPGWGFAIFFIVLVLYTRSFRAAAGLIKEGGKRFREAWSKKA